MNPYKQLLTNKSAARVIPGFSKLPGQGSPAINSAGYINASSKEDLIQQIGALMQASLQGTIGNSREEKIEAATARKEALAELVADTSGEGWRMMGEALAAEIYETTNREGFARRLVQYREVGTGEVNMVTIKQKLVYGFMATSPSQVMASEIRQRRIMPPEFHVNGYILIDTKEIAVSTSDILEEKYEEGLEAVMVQEDRLWKKMADQAAGVRNDVQYFSNLSPSVFARMIWEINRWGIPVTTCLFAPDLWIDVISNSDFAGVFDPVTKWELLQEGFLGSMYGVSIMTDNFRQPVLKVLNQGDIYMVGDPTHHGVMTMRGSMTAEPINKFAEGEAKKGWFLDEIISMVLANSKSICAGRRI